VIARIRVVLAITLLVVISVVMFPVHLLLLWLKHPWRIRMPRYWHRIAVRLIGVKVVTHGVPERRRPLLIVSNHSSWLDILVLASVADVAFVAKIEVRDWPIFGVLARLQRSVFVVRVQKRRSQDQANEIADRMNAGEIVVLFPEGTTSDGNRLFPTKSTLYGAATSAVATSPEGRVFVQPVAVAYTRIHGLPMGHFHRPVAAWPGDVTIGPHLMGVLDTGALDAEVAFGEPIEVTSSTNRKELAQAADSQMRAMLQQLLYGRRGQG
jgi:1-acyl-sn-glycerol-3-phosphate acyltransferase